MRRVRPVFVFLIGAVGDLAFLYGLLIWGSSLADLFLLLGFALIILAAYFGAASFPVKKEKPHNLSVK